jgi:hypothetical protein
MYGRSANLPTEFIAVGRLKSLPYIFSRLLVLYYSVAPLITKTIIYYCRGLTVN